MDTKRTEVSYICSREVRVIPKGWQHPEGRALLPEQMPGVSGEDETEIIAYETVSEGTPISPAFPNTPAGRPDLVRHCSAHCTTFGKHRADGEAWAAILFGEGAAVVLADGSVEVAG